MNDNFLPANIPGFASETTLVNGVRIHYWVGGNPNGPPVLLWHGFLGTSYVWNKVMPILAAAGYAVLAPDMRGYGDSDKPAGATGYDGRALAAEFRALVHLLGFGAGQPLLIAAHDMGHLQLFSGPLIFRTKCVDCSTWKCLSCCLRFCRKSSATRQRLWRRVQCGGGSCLSRLMCRSGLL